MKAPTAKPPANESRANRLARRSTTDRDGPSARDPRSPDGAVVVPDVPDAPDSTAGDNERATAAPAKAAGTITRNHRWSLGAPAHRWRVSAGSATASAPTDP